MLDTPDALPVALLDDDGAPVSQHRPGAVLPGGVRAWEQLGVGMRCETWLAWSPAAWAPVVVKFPRPHQLDHPRARRSLSREVAALGGNLHPGLPRLYVDGTHSADHAIPYVVLEHVDGPALDDELGDRGAFDDAEVAVLACALLAALRTVHARGLVHVDLKPANVLLRAGRPVLVDFGSARAAGSPQPQGRLIGSPGYAAPDLEAGLPIDAAMDVYGLGVTLAEAGTGRELFDADLGAADRPIDAFDGSGEVGALVRRMLATEPSDRPMVDEALDQFAHIAESAGHQLRPDFAR